MPCNLNEMNEVNFVDLERDAFCQHCCKGRWFDFDQMDGVSFVPQWANDQSFRTVTKIAKHGRKQFRRGSLANYVKGQ